MTMIAIMTEPLIMAIVVPLLGAAGIALAGKSPNLREGVTLVTATILAWIIWNQLPAILNGARPEAHLLEIIPGVSLAFRLEPLGMIFALVASSLWIVNSVYSIGYMRANREKHQTRFYIFFAVAISATMGIALSGNLLTLFLFYEVLTLSTYPLVTHKGDSTALRGGRIYLGILIATSIGLFLPAMLWTWSVAGTLDFVPGGILAGSISGVAVGTLLALFVFGTGKAALMPVHFWLPAAMVAPTPVSAFLHAVAVVKAGVFVVTKIIVYIFGIDFLAGEKSASWLLYLAGFTIITASIIALRQDNLKKRLAYSTVSQLSYVIMAAALFVPLGIIAAALHIAAHAAGKITLFFAAGSIYTAAHKSKISELDGIGRCMPWTMGAFAIGSLAMIGLPFTAGFISKWYLILGANGQESLFALGVIIVSTILNAGYFLPIVYRAFFRPLPVGSKTTEQGEAPLPIIIALIATTALILLIFFVHGPLVDLARDLVETAA